VSQRLSTAKTRRYERGLIEDEKYGETEMSERRKGQGNADDAVPLCYDSTKPDVVWPHTLSLSQRTRCRSRQIPRLQQSSAVPISGTRTERVSARMQPGGGGT
jgi:hypothetical protein